MGQKGIEGYKGKLRVKLGEVQNSRSARFSRCEIRILSAGGGKSLRVGGFWGNAAIVGGEVSRVCVCTLCGLGVLCGGGAPGEREGERWGEN